MELTCVLWPWGHESKILVKTGNPSCSKLQQDGADLKRARAKIGQVLLEYLRTSSCSGNPRNSEDFHRLQVEPNQYLCQRSQCGNHVAILMPCQAALALADIAEATFVYPCCLLDVLRITENDRLP